MDLEERELISNGCDQPHMDVLGVAPIVMDAEVQWDLDFIRI